MPTPPGWPQQQRRLTFGDVVRSRRGQLGLSQLDLAERAGCNRQTIVRIETAVRSPSLDRIFLLADALELRVGELFREFDRRDRG